MSELATRQESTDESPRREGVFAEGAALLAVAGVVVQVVSYWLVYNFYEAFSIEPSQVGVSLLNASLKMQGTSIVVGLLVIGAGAVTLSVLSIARALKRRRSTTVTLSQAKVNGQGARTLLIVRGLLRAVAIMAIFSLSIYIWFLTEDIASLAARREIEALAKPQGSLVDRLAGGMTSFVQFDLAPQRVKVRWHDAAHLPPELPATADGRNVYDGLLLGTNGDSTTLVFDLGSAAVGGSASPSAPATHDTRTVIVPTADIAISVSSLVQAS